MQHFRLSPVVAAFLCVSGILAIGLFLQAQETAQLSVRVVDEAGGALPGVTLRVSTPDGRSFVFVTDANGRVAFPSGISAGTYRLTAELTGFAVRSTDVTVRSGENRALVLTLPVGAPSPPRAAPPQDSPPRGAAPPPRPPSPPTTSAPPGATAGRGPAGEGSVSRRQPVYWNVWQEEGTVGPQFVPAPSLKPATDYLLVLDLATVRYENGVASRAGSDELNKTITEWALKTTERTVTVKTVLLVSDLFDQPAQFVKELTIDLDKLRKQLQAANTPSVNALNVLRTTRDPDFLLGRVSYGIRTRAGSLGPSSVGLSIWAGNDRLVPVDELSVPVCIATEATTSVCKGTSATATTLNGVDSFRIAQEGPPTPDASLHFVDLDGQTIKGVFHRNDCVDCANFVTWTLSEHSFAGLHDRLVKTTLADFERAASDQQRLRIGRALSNVLFASNTAEGANAQGAFDAFVQATRPESSNANRRSIFVRMVGKDSQMVLIPFGMAAVELQGGMVDFVGNQFRVEMPLPVQNYEADDQPIAKWYLAIPPAGTDELGRARSQAEDSINKWQQQATQTFSDMTAVSTWIGARETEQAGTALVVLSHHADDRLYFSPKDQLTADEIARRFMRPAIAILDGCGTGAAAGRLIQNLNNAGFGAVIATATPVDSEIAGDFLACMAETLDRNRDDATFNLSLAFSDAVRCVRDDKDHRARALTWLMLGNGSLRLTSPHKQP